MSARGRYRAAQQIVDAIREDARCAWLEDEAVGWPNLSNLSRQHIYVGELEAVGEQTAAGIKDGPLPRDDTFRIRIYFRIGDKGATAADARDAYLDVADALDQYVADEPRLGFETNDLDVHVRGWGEDDSVLLAQADGWQMFARHTVTVRQRATGGRP